MTILILKTPAACDSRAFAEQSYVINFTVTLSETTKDILYIQPSMKPVSKSRKIIFDAVPAHNCMH